MDKFKPTHIFIGETPSLRGNPCQIGETIRHTPSLEPIISVKIMVKGTLFTMATSPRLLKPMQTINNQEWSNLIFKEGL